MGKKIVNSSWNRWDPKAYLKEFYSGDVAQDEIETVAFLAKLAKKINSPKKILDFGCGPTLHHVFPFIPHVSEVHVADLLKPNLDEISKFLKKEKDYHNWDKHIAYTLECEGQKKPTAKAIEQRKKHTVEKITKLMKANARNSNPMGIKYRGAYPVVISCYCADSATNNRKDFTLYVKNIASLIQPGGLFIIACLRNSRYYKSGSSYFPSANVNEHFLLKILKYNFIAETIKIKVKKLPNHKEQGYTGIILAYATKNNKK